MVDNFSQVLKQSGPIKTARFVAFTVEDALNSKFDYENDSRAYTTKAKTLVFNLSKNEVAFQKLFKVNE